MLLALYDVGKERGTACRETGLVQKPSISIRLTLLGSYSELRYNVGIKLRVNAYSNPVKAPFPVRATMMISPTNTETNLRRGLDEQPR